MKNIKTKETKLTKLTIYLLVFLLIGMALGYFISQVSASKMTSFPNREPKKMSETNNPQGKQTNRGNCLSDDCLLVDDLNYPAGELSVGVQDALDKAIDDEYHALAFYEAVTNKFGMLRPFSMIKNAEEQHIASLKAIYDKYGLKAPASTWSAKISAPSTIKEACQVGVDAEIANADLYQKELLPAVVKYEDIKQVFTNLMNASRQKHLPAFEKCN